MVWLGGPVSCSLGSAFFESVPRSCVPWSSKTIQAVFNRAVVYTNVQVFPYCGIPQCGVLILEYLINLCSGISIFGGKIHEN